MTRLILTSSDTGAGGLMGAGLADCVIPFKPRFVWGQLPSPIKLEALLSARSALQDIWGSHWLDLTEERLQEVRTQGLGLIEFCRDFDAVELWIDPDPNSQLQLIWLLDYLRPHANVISRLAIVQADTQIGAHSPEELALLRLPAVPIRSSHLETGSESWAAYRAPTPVAWFDLLARDLGALPQLRNAVVALLEELPMRGCGLGATEMRMLELISTGRAQPYDLFPGQNKRNERQVFDYWEVGTLLDGLAHCPAAAVSGLDEGPFDPEMHEDGNRHKRYQQSRLSLTELGKAILAQSDDFSRHNPIHRWWGGTELTNDRLWRWEPLERRLVAP